MDAGSLEASAGGEFNNKRNMEQYKIDEQSTDMKHIVNTAWTMELRE